MCKSFIFFLIIKKKLGSSSTFFNKYYTYIETETNFIPYILFEKSVPFHRLKRGIFLYEKITFESEIMYVL